MLSTACPSPTDTSDSPDDDTDAELDADGDGFLSNAVGGPDCDDSNPEVHPNADEICNGLDDDCEGTIDEQAVDMQAWSVDADGDGFGADGSEVLACAAPSHGVLTGGDCDDLNPSVSPGATEQCNGIDDDCDGEIDLDAQDATAWYPDVDEDGWGDEAGVVEACDAPAGYIALGGDCDDASASTHPGAVDSCNGVDDDCSGTADDGEAPTWYLDSDGDGFGDLSAAVDACAAPANYLPNAGDCDDSNSSASPDAAEVCDGVDNDCDGGVDEAGGVVMFADADADGFGDALSTDDACEPAAGYVSDNTDCDDGDNSAFPGNAESCDGVDNDCDGGVDEAGGVVMFADADADGFGDALSTDDACEPAAGYVSDNTDCDDGDNSAFPGNAESCDGVDNDCDGSVDEGWVPDGTLFYKDSDGDGFGDATSRSRRCTQPAGYVTDNTDCDDGAAANYPGAPEICDTVDNNCDGSVDEGGVCLHDEGSVVMIHYAPTRAAPTHRTLLMGAFVDDRQAILTAAECRLGGWCFTELPPSNGDFVSLDPWLAFDDLVATHYDVGAAITLGSYRADRFWWPTEYSGWYDNTVPSAGPMGLGIPGGVWSGYSGVNDISFPEPVAVISPDPTALLHVLPNSTVTFEWVPASGNDLYLVVANNSGENWRMYKVADNGRLDLDTASLGYTTVPQTLTFILTRVRTAVVDVGGNPTTVFVRSEQRMSGEYSPPWVDIEAGMNHTCGIRWDGTLACWGLDNFGQVSWAPLGTFIDVSVGGTSSCAIAADTTIKCWGNASTQALSPPLDSGYVELELGDDYNACARKADDSVTCWGPASTQNSNPPFLLTTVGVGSHHNVGIRTDGRLFGWGMPGIAAWMDATGSALDVDAGWEVSCAVRFDGSIDCWGASLNPVLSPPAGNNYVFLDIGDAELACALTDLGAVKCWGSDATNGVSGAPTGTGYSNLRVGWEHACALDSGGEVVCWGSNSRGQLNTPP